MNQEVFLAMHNIGAFNGPLSFNINVNQRPNSNAGTIVGFTATFLANVDGVNTDISEILLDIDFAELSIGEQTVKLEVIDRAVFQGSNSTGQRFVFYNVVPTALNIIPVINEIGGNDELEEINFTPIISEGRFSFSDFNPLISNVNRNELSIDRMISDRNESTIQPQNSASLFTTSASKAQISDSLYFDTGWSGARYVGSKTNATDFRGIEPAIGGKSFTGVIFSNQTTDSVVCGLTGSINDDLRDELLHSGELDFPDFNELGTNARVGSPAVDSATRTTFGIRLDGGTGIQALSSSIAPEIVPNSIVRLSGEKMRVKRIFRVVGLSDFQVEVERGYLNTTATTHNVNTQFSASAFTRVFKIEDNLSKISSVANNKILVENNQTIITTDAFGTIIAKVNCSGSI